MKQSPRHYVCIHGHFYQPPRENPWLESIEDQASAYPFPNWNQRILAECYRPNAASRIIDGAGRIVRIANNYGKISFNFGSTLLSWIERYAPDVYAAIQEADRASQERFGGHGSAMAQAYNHMIMPLASRRDKITQVIWGIRDFERHFARRPAGMWLPETAVDLETLDIMAERGIEFTILAPGQARRVRPLGSEEWWDVSGGRIDPGRAYRVMTSADRHIDVFFYDGPVSNAVAFERLLQDGRRFADRLITHPKLDGPVLFHIATDGETYGHHHKYGDMALAYALQYIENDRSEHLINYGQFRELHAPEFEVEIIENTAWSCAHGVGRWSRDCGCHTGAHSAWNQAWRKPLRESLDWLRDRLAGVFEQIGARLLADPWAARDDYITVVTDRSSPSVDGFLQRHRSRELSREEQCTALQLLEMQRHAMLMYASCGWFFDDLAGTEAVQILQYAARAIDLSQRVSENDIESEFVARLAVAHSNRPECGDGRRIYEDKILPAKVDLHRVIAHYAVTSLFDDNRECKEIYCFQIEALDLHTYQAGKARLAVGTVRCVSTITRAESTLSFGALHLGDHNLTGGVRRFVGEEAYRKMLADVAEAFERADLVATQRRLDLHFPTLSFSLKSLFPDHQKRVLDRILQGPLAEAEAAYSQLYAHHAPLMRYLVSFDLPMPGAFRTAAQFILELRLRRALEQDIPDLGQVRSHIDQAQRVGVSLADIGLYYQWQQSLERLIQRVATDPGDIRALASLTGVAELVAENNFEVDLWQTQNESYKLLQKTWPMKMRQAYDGNPDAEKFLALFIRLCRAVKIAAVPTDT